MSPELRAYTVYALIEAGQQGMVTTSMSLGRKSDLSAEGLAMAGLAMMQT